MPGKCWFAVLFEAGCKAGRLNGYPALPEWPVAVHDVLGRWRGDIADLTADAFLVRAGGLLRARKVTSAETARVLVQADSRPVAMTSGTVPA